MRAVLPSESLEKLYEAALLRSFFEGDKERLLRSGASETQVAEALNSGKKVLFKGGLNPANVEAVLLYRHIKTIIDSSIKHDALSQTRGSESIDSLLTHKWWGLLAFLGLMYLVFQSVYSWAGPFMDLSLIHI